MQLTKRRRLILLVVVAILLGLVGWSAIQYRLDNRCGQLIAWSDLPDIGPKLSEWEVTDARFCSFMPLTSHSKIYYISGKTTEEALRRFVTSKSHLSMGEGPLSSREQEWPYEEAVRRLRLSPAEIAALRRRDNLNIDGDIARRGWIQARYDRESGTFIAVIVR